MRRRRRKNLPTEPVSLQIEKLSHEGRGIAHNGGKVVFVAGALPGEQVSAILTSRRDSFDEAKLEQVLAAAPERVEPPCSYAGICGGCSLQHLHPDAQLAFKEAMLFEQLEHAAGGSTFTRLAALTGPVSGYRRKARLAVRYVHKKGQVLVGFREKQSSFITQMDSCEVLDGRLAGLLPLLPGLLGGLQTMREIPQIEVAAGDPDSDGPTVALIFRHLQPLPPPDLAALITFSQEQGFALYLQAGGPDSVCKVFPSAGEDRLQYRLPAFDLTFGFHPTDFTQVNGIINRAMIEQAVRLLDLSTEDTVLDLFCGLGNFTLPVARRCHQVIGIEGSDAMVSRAEENARRNGVDNVAFYRADLTAAMSGASWLAAGYNKVLLDPPRSGAIEILPDIITLAPERIVYVSCNPATLARDTAFLTGHGYKLESAGAMDMFPHTAHVEAMALFTRRSKA